MKTQFKTKLNGTATGPTGIIIPAKNIADLGTSRKPAVKVTVNGYNYLSTVAVMAGEFCVAFSSAHRAATGLKAGDPIDVTLELETAPRIVEVPDDLAAALKAKAGARAAFDAAAPSHRKEWVRSVVEAKAAETRARRIAKVVDALG